MGAVVPVAEPEWSGAHRGLCLYASRVLQAAWDEQVRAGRAGGGLVGLQGGSSTVHGRVRRR